VSKGMKVLVTGGSGRIGRIFAKHHSDTYALRLTYNAHPFEAPGCEVVQMDLTDFGSVLRAMQGMEAVVHFGADSALQTPWESTLNNNIVGTYNAYEAARQAGVPRLVFASSNHAAGFDIAEGKLVGPDAPIRPDSLYGVSKVFGEALGRYYHDQYGMQVICLRIGSCHGGDTYEGQLRHLKERIARGVSHPYNVVQLLSIWLSAADMCQFVQRSLESDCPFGIFYGISDNTPAAFDLSETKRQLGYAPKDNVQDLFDVPIAELD
jgi:NAD+ dependent glucose-6-phosphate dehydrogenase